MKLTQNQKAILSSAYENEHGAATRPIGAKDWQADKTASALIDKGLFKEVRAKGGAPIWREDGEGRSYALKILKAGREAIAGQGGDRVVEANAAICTQAPSQTQARSGKARRPCPNDQSSSSSSADVAARSPRAGSRQALVVAMLGEETGATLDDLISATGWLPHTTRAALTGLRKKGFNVEREREDGSPSIYRITQEPSEAVA